MELQCEICFNHFDVESHRPKGLPCGHTICKDCVMNPELGRKCPTCRKDLPGEPDDIPDNILAIQLIENGGAPPCKRLKREDTEVQQLQRGVDAGKKVVEALRLAVPKAVEALNRQLDTSVAHLRELEEALEQRVQRDAAGGDGGPTPEQLKLAVQLEDSLCLLTANKCSVVVGESGSSWKATMQLGESDDFLRLLLLQLLADGQLAKVDSTPVPSACAYVGPPMISILTINLTDLTGGDLNVNEIIRDKGRIDNIRCIKDLKGEGSDKLLRVVASHPLHVEELGFLGKVDPKVMYEVQKMSSLKRLEVKCIPECDDYPDLPLQLEELAINSPSEQQVDCVMRMPALHSLSIWNYMGENLTFPHSEYATLRWLRVAVNNYHKPTMLSLIRAHASSLQELQVYCTIDDDEEDGCFYFPDLGRELSACGLLHLRRLVLVRQNNDLCTNIAGCVMQRQNVRASMPAFVEVVCDECCTTSVVW
ncbi:uncharacterized protein LOC113211297 [Frankliniella occidentalis]|uniref:Uncharacterized protein LOC113211297 n=1 Tax=Frankliniella occidentalis TaxID=133901 RepID=A0A6J1T429_FRAOC|nr:uncharacterized protein LOC113211297 [Frankliniella occidentalis]